MVAWSRSSGDGASGCMAHNLDSCTMAEERRGFGGGADARRARVERSPQWRDGRFRNALPRVDGPWTRMMREFFFGGSAHRRPSSPIPVERRVRGDYDVAPASGLRVTWLGHSTTLL